MRGCGKPPHVRVGVEVFGTPPLFSVLTCLRGRFCMHLVKATFVGLKQLHRYFVKL